MRSAIHHVCQSAVRSSSRDADGGFVGIVFAGIKLAGVAERNRRSGPCEIDELRGLPAIQRKFHHALRIDDFSDARAVRLHQRCVRLHFNLFGDLADL